jgi:hypothetical protein
MYSSLLLAAWTEVYAVSRFRGKVQDEQVQVPPFSNAAGLNFTHGSNPRRQPG